jgi:A/G-specific adenine glycosylase
MSGGQHLLDPAELTRLYGDNGCLNTETITSFQQTIYFYYLANPRPMPWRETNDPYRILISEIMLQQTQVERVKSKYDQFLECFPTLADLASAPLAEVLTVWQGLGYNRRAIALKRCAEEIQARFNGCFPTTVPDLESLPGIGHYTARAVAAFAFGISEPFIETNIRTVFIHYFFHGRENVHDREIMPFVAMTLDRSDPREWYYALMDFGVHLKQLHPNPGRRSCHHVPQSKFEGSNRQLRSRLLRMLLEYPGTSTASLATLLHAGPAAVEKNLADMEREGFLQRTGGFYQVYSKTEKG